MPKRIARTLELASVAVALGYVSLYLFFASQRVVYPFELEWMEGGSLEHLARVLRGQPLFVTPSLQFVPFPYPPFYYYLAAALSPVTGAGFTTLRLISVLSSLGTAALIFGWVRRETRSAVWAAACAGVFIATWRASGLFFDIARVDSLFCFLLLGSLYLVRFRPTQRGLLLAAFVAFLAVMTKQTGVLVVALVALWCIAADWNSHGRAFARVLEWRRTRAYALPLAAFTGVGTLLLNGVLDESFLLHVVGAQQRHGILGWKFGLFFGGDLVTTLPLVSGVVLAWLLLARREEPADDAKTGRTSFYAVVAVGVVLAVLIPRVKVSGAANSLIPVHAWLAILFGVGLGRLRAAARRRYPAASGPPFEAFAALCCLAQLTLLFQVPRGYVPTAADRAGGERFLEELRRVEGDVLIPAQGYLAGLVGKPVYAHQMPVSDYAKSGLPEAPALQEEYRRAIRERRFEVIYDSNTGFVRSYAGPELLAEHYRMAGWVFPDASVFLPISGAQIRPGKIWVRRESEAKPASPRASPRAR